MPFAQAEGAALYWKVEGAEGSPPLVLLNSIGTDMDLWSDVLPLLRPAFRLLRIDTRGHGASDAPAGDYSLAILARDVAAVMDAADIGSAAVAGVSLGGMIAMQLALDMPDRVTALALICTSATMDPTAWDLRVTRVRGEGMASIVDIAMSRFLSPAFGVEHPEIADTVRLGLTSMAAAGYAGCGAAIRDMNLAERIRALHCPVLVVTGTGDSSTPLEGHGEHLLGRIPNARHVPLASAHLAPLEAPVPLAETIAVFLSQRDP